MEIAVICITAATLVFNSVYDIKYRLTNTISVYLGVAVAGVIKVYGLILADALLYGLICAAAFAVLLVCVHALLRGGIGGGDFDIVYLIFIGSGIAGVIQSLIIGLFTAICYSCITGKKDTIPLVPFITVGYAVKLILWG